MPTRVNYIPAGTTTLEEDKDGSESPSSATSTSKLISRPRSFTSIQNNHRPLRATSSNPMAFSQNSLKHTHITASRPDSSTYSNVPLIHCGSSSGSRYEDTRNARIFIRRIPSPTMGESSEKRFQKFSFSSEDVYHHNNTQYEYHSSDVFLPPDQGNELGGSSHTRGGTSSNDDLSRFSRPMSVEQGTYISRTSSLSDIITSLPLHQSSLADEALNAPRMSRQSSLRRSIGGDWTREHWRKLKDLELESERARRCSKLSSGFAPLMVFGGLVFVCIGISASTNTGKDQERLRKLSAAPIAMGVFMLTLGGGLIFTWFSCRSRARQLEHKVLHGSPHNSIVSQDNVNTIQSIVAKLNNPRSGFLRGARPPTPVTQPTTDNDTMTRKTKRVSVQLSNGLREVRNVPAPESLITRETSV